MTATRNGATHVSQVSSRWIPTGRVARRRWGPAVSAALLLALSLALGSGLGAAQPLTPAFAATTVTACPTNETALSNDIANAGSGGTVAFNCPSATTIPFGTSITITQTVTLDASGVQGGVTFDGGGSTQLFVVNSGGGLSLIHLTLQHGSAPHGGAIYNNGGTVSITDSTLSGNSATYAGGAILNYGTLSITASTLSGNAALAPSMPGGAIENGYGMVTITDSTLSDNSAYYGGAIYNADTLTITNSTLSGNAVGNGDGGAIYGTGTLSITDSTLSGNAAGNGGGAFLNSGTLSITDSTLSTNSASNGGGAIFNGGTLSITASTLSTNSARVGGAIDSVDRLNITDSTLSGNSAGTGGAIDSCCTGVTVSIGGSIIVNSGSGWSSCFVWTPITDKGYNLTDSGDCGLNGTTDLTNTNPQLDPKGLQNNGGPTLTIALLPTSPAIDANSCTFKDANGNTISTDQRGYPRPDNGEAVCDIGAYEFSDAIPGGSGSGEGTDTPELDSGVLLITGLLPIGGALLYRRRARRQAS